MRRLALVFFASIAVAQAADGPVTIDVLPRVLFAGDAIRLRCRVPRAAENRALEWGVEGYRSSTEQLDGDQARITHEWIIQDVPCAGMPYCLLKRNGQRDVRIEARIEVRGCEE